MKPLVIFTFTLEGNKRFRIACRSIRRALRTLNRLAGDSENVIHLEISIRIALPRRNNEEK